MDAAIIVTWSGPMPGREKEALDYAAKVEERWSGLAKDGKCSQPELFFLSGGHGLWIVRGDHDTLLALHMAPETQLSAAKGELVLRDFSMELAQTGSAAEAHLRNYAEAGRELALL